MSGEKTEEPTHFKLDELRKKGQLPPRKNVTEASLIVVSLITIFSFFGLFYHKLLMLLRASIDGIFHGFHESFSGSLEASYGAFRMVIVFCLICSSSTLLLGLLLNRFNFAPQALEVKFAKLNPVNNLKSLFSKTTLYNFFRILFIFVTFSSILYFSIFNNLKLIINATYCGLECLVPVYGNLITNAIIYIVLVIVIMAMVDFRIQSKIYMSQNKMSKDEIKREFKNQEGDPLIKGNRKSLALSDAEALGFEDVTHVVYGENQLVAILFYEDSEQLPFVVFKIKGGRVNVMISKFKELRIPVIFLPDVANEFYHMGAVGKFLPTRCRRGMDKILRKVMGL